jgi:hypothetical protein
MKSDEISAFPKRGEDARTNQQCVALLNAFRTDVAAGRVELAEEWAESKIMSVTKTRIFISHAAADAELAAALITLVEAGVETPTGTIRCTSVPGYNLEGGDDGPEVLRKNLSSSGVVLGLLTTRSIASSYVLMELGAAWAFEKRAIPLIGPGATFGDLPGPFKDVHALTMTSKTDMAELIPTIARYAQLAPTNNAGKVQAALESLATILVAHMSRSPDPATVAAPTAPTVGTAEGLSLVKAWLHARMQGTHTFSYAEISEDLSVPVSPTVLRQVLPMAAAGTNWTVEAHEHSVTLTWNAPPQARVTVSSRPRRGW